MNMRQQIGQLLAVGGVTGGFAHTREADRIMEAIAGGEVGGVYLGYPHFRSPEHARFCTEELQAVAPYPLFCAADFETGPAYNCEGDAAHLPYLMGLGFINDPEVTEQAAEITARQALAMGLNWLFSPCLDVNLNPDNPIIGIRSFGETPECVSHMGTAYIQGCRKVGILCTAKHFPGGGNTLVDTHIGCAQDIGDLTTWEHDSLPPFIAAVAAGVDAIITSHHSVPFLDPSGTPATFSRVMLTEILRERLGFTGLILTDSLGMEGVAGTDTPERCLRAFEAGCDVLLAPYDPGVIPAFERALEEGRISPERLQASLARVLQAKERITHLPPAAFHPDDNRMAFEIGRRSARVQRGGEKLPLSPGSLAVLTQWRNDETRYFPREPGVLAWLQHGLQVFDPAAPLIPLSRDCPECDHAAVIRAVGEARTVLINTIVKNYAGDPYRGKLSEGTCMLIRRLAAMGKEVLLVVLGTPYALRDVPETAIAICTGGDTPGCVQSVLELLFGGLT